MTSLLCFLVGLYLVIDSAYLGIKASGGDGNLIIAKYVFAFMSGWYLVSVPVTEVLFYFDFEIVKPISEEAANIRLLLGFTVALFMWADTCYRVLTWLRMRKTGLYLALVGKDSMPQRRRDQ